MDAAGPTVIGTSSISGLQALSPVPQDAAVIYFSGANCNPLTAAAILVYAPGTANQNLFHTVGYPGVAGANPPLTLGALDGSTVVIDTTTQLPYTGTLAGIVSVGVSNLTGFNIAHNPPYRKADVQYLACGNVDGSPVADIFGGHLGADWRLPLKSGDVNGDTVVDANDLGVVIDMQKDTNWCDTDGAGGDDIDTTATHAVGDTYQVAICLTTSPNVPAGFNFNLIYDDALNTCVPVDCGSDAKCLDSDPDANTGGTLYSTPSLGTVGWNCALDASIVPNCDTNSGTHGPLAGSAFLECLSGAAESDLTLPIGVGVSAPLAVLTFHANAVGTDTLQLDALSVIKKGGAEIVACSIGDDPSKCMNAGDIKANATATPPAPTGTPRPPTNTPLPPTATFTPVPGVRMEKVPAVANLWLMKGGCVNPALGKGCLEIDEWIYGIADTCDWNVIINGTPAPLATPACTPEGLGAWENQIRFDHKFISLTKTPDNTWLFSGGRWGGPVVPNPIPGGPDLVTGCYVTIVSEDSILEGCVSKDDPNTPGLQPGPEGSGLIERIIIVPNINDLVYRSDFRPTKDNGIVTDIVDDNCEVTDTLGEQIPGTLPGQLTTVCGDAHITIRFLEGDEDLNCRIDVADDQALAFRYGSHLGSQLYDRWYDLEPKFSDDDIDIKDLQFVFGRNYSTCENPVPNDQGTPVPPIDP
jgi:hypothetical protein